jgi:hypothetical protein
MMDKLQVKGLSELGLLAVVNKEVPKEEGTKARAGSSTHSVEHKKATVVGKLPEAVKAEVNNLVANCKTEINRVSSVFYQGEQIWNV